jgi:hypothetical protein
MTYRCGDANKVHFLNLCLMADYMTSPTVVIYTSMWDDIVKSATASCILTCVALCATQIKALNMMCAWFLIQEF